MRGRGLAIIGEITETRPGGHWTSGTVGVALPPTATFSNPVLEDRQTIHVFFFTSQLIMWTDWKGVNRLGLKEDRVKKHCPTVSSDSQKMGGMTAFLILWENTV